MSSLSWVLVGAVATLVFLRWVVPNPLAIRFVEVKNLPREWLVVAGMLFGVFLVMTQLTLLKSLWPAYLELPSRLAWWVWVLLGLGMLLGFFGLIGRLVQRLIRKPAQ